MSTIHIIADLVTGAILLQFYLLDRRNRKRITKLEEGA